MQFVADIRAPARDNGAIYILSSRFHRYFLKNLRTNEINIRILRIDGVASGDKTVYVPQYENKLKYVTQISQPIYTTPSYLDFSPVTKAPTYLNSFFNSIRQPYSYEPVGIINKGNQNPFTSLNTGERPEPPSYSPPKFQTSRPLQFNFDFDHNLYNRAPTSFHDYNGLRVAKSTSYNTSVVF